VFLSVCSARRTWRMRNVVGVASVAWMKRRRAVSGSVANVYAPARLEDEAKAYCSLLLATTADPLNPFR